MASRIIPFPALLPDPKRAAKIIAPPYDVVDREQATALVAGNSDSLLHITRAEVGLQSSVAEHTAAVYEQAAKNLQQFVDRGLLVRTEPSLFVYRIRQERQQNIHVQTGIVAGVSALAYDDGWVKKHEKTKPVKEQDRTDLALKLAAHVEPVMLAHRRSPNIKALIEAEVALDALYDLKDHEGVQHTLWRVQAVDAMQAALNSLDALYIADGHHRSAAASRVAEAMQGGSSQPSAEADYNFFPAVIFPDDELLVYQYDWSGDAASRPPSRYQMADIMKIADESGTLPPKSTWFAPKLISGLFVYTFSRP